MKIIEWEPPSEIICGVYFLMQNGNLKYIGKSVDIHRRVIDHRRDRQITGVYMVELPEQKIARVESLLIACWNPPWNSNGRTGAPVTAAIETVIASVRVFSRNCIPADPFLADAYTKKRSHWRSAANRSKLGIQEGAIHDRPFGEYAQELAGHGPLLKPRD